MFYIVYNQNLTTGKRVHIYSSERALNNDWLNKFKKYCTTNNIAPFELGARYKLIPLGEDDVSVEPLEIKSFSHWNVTKCNGIKELSNTLIKIFEKNSIN